MRAFYVLVVCTFAATVIHSCESKEHQTRVADFQNMYPRHHSTWKTVEENKVKASTISSEAELPGSNVNPEEIVQHAKNAKERAQTSPNSLEDWEKELKKKMAAQKATEKTMQRAEVVSPKAHSQDREEMEVHAASPEPRMTYDEWKNKFYAARAKYMNKLKNNQQQVKTAASPVKVYRELKKDLGHKQEISEGVKIASHRRKPLPYPHYPSTGKEAVLQMEREKILQRYNADIQNAMMLNRHDVKEIIDQEAAKHGYPLEK